MKDEKTLEVGKILQFDQRASEYASRTNLMPNTWKGDVETAYTIAASEQLDMDRDVYIPCINYLLQAVENMRQLVVGYSSNISHIQAAQLWSKGADEQLGKIPYMLRKLPSGPFLKTRDEDKSK